MISWDIGSTFVKPQNQPFNAGANAQGAVSRRVAVDSSSFGLANTSARSTIPASETGTNISWRESDCVA